jgi:hypothetical protein
MGGIFNKITELFVRLKDVVGNGITSSDLGFSKRGLDVKVAGHTFDEVGNLHIITPEPTAPPGRVILDVELQDDIAGTDNNFTIIPVGEKIVIQRLKAGSEVSAVGGSKVELLYAPVGTVVGEVLIEALYVDGDSASVDLNYESPEGDGTNAILLRRARLGGGAIEIFAKWEGYY